MYKYTCMMLAIFLCGIASGQKAVSNEMQNLVAAGIEFQQTNILKFETTDVHSRDLNLEGLSAGAILNLDVEAIQHLFQDQQNFISLSVPITNRTNIILTLKRHEIFTPDFKLYTSSNPTQPIEYTPGLHYMGVVEGDPNSIVALSVFKDQVMAMISTDEGNMVIGRINGEEDNRHIFYNDRDLDTVFSFACETEDNGLEYTKEQLSAVQNTRDAGDCVRIYIEINDDIVAAKGGAVAATNYITAILNQCFVIYADEQLTLIISEILAWTTASPYTGNSSNAMLASYQTNTGFFNGDLSHLISFDSIFGGIAPGINGICNGSPGLSKCFSGIRHNYDNVPIFSWPVFVISHEMGHLMGSHHTHTCVWNGNGTAIDGCGPTGCAPDPPLPINGGTIMSYCYPSNGSYINFNEGFGPQPGNVIRNSVNASGNCLSECSPPTSYCMANGVNSSTEYIDKVVLNSINNLSGNNGGYEDFTSLSTTLQAGNTYTITLKPKFTGGNNTKYWRVWIDYNQDFDWYEAGESIANGTGNNSISLTFTVPAYAPASTTRMRVAMRLAGYPSFCGTLPLGEVEDYTVNIVGSSPTCSDGIQNQGEEGIDCGGPCTACSTCSDGIQNQDETGVDCGGVCAACPAGDSTVLLGSYFETGMDGWIDGGSDVARVSSAYSYEGLYSIKLADNSGSQSAMTSPVFNLFDAVGLQMTFYFYAASMESGEDFWVLYNDGSGSWTNIGTFVSGPDFNNSTNYFASLTVPNFAPTAAGSLRIQCDASDNNDQVFIDEVTIIKLNGTEFIESGVAIQEAAKPEVTPGQDTQSDFRNEPVIYPNPTSDFLVIELPSPATEDIYFRIISPTGKRVFEKAAGPGIALQQLEVSDLTLGMYFLQVVSKGRVQSVNKFVKL